MLLIIQIILINVFVIIQFGYWVLKILNFPETGEEKLKTPFPVNAAIYFFTGEAFVVFVLLISGFYLSVFFIYPLWVLAALLIPFTIREVFIKIKSGRVAEVNCFRGIPAASLIAVFSLPALFSAFYDPLMEGDSRSIWFFHAKVFFYKNFIPMDFLKNPDYSFSHLDYPPFIPLLAVFFNKSVGSWNEIYCKSFLYFNLLGYLTLIYFIFRKEKVSTWISLIFTGFFAHIFGRQSVNGDADVHLALLFFAALYFGIIFLNSKTSDESKPLFLFITFLCSACLLKNEGMVYSVGLFLYMFIYSFRRRKEKIKGLVRGGIFFLAPLLLWFGKCGLNGVKSDMAVFKLFTEYSPEQVLTERLPLIFSYYIDPRSIYVDETGALLILPLIIFLCVMLAKVIFRFKLSALDVHLAFVLAGLNLIIVLVYLNTPHNLEWHILHSFTRVIIVTILPLNLLVCRYLSKLLKEFTRPYLF